MRNKFLINVLLIFLLAPGNLLAQDSAQQCKVLVESLKGKYIGKCKRGLAEGKGEAIGAQRYEGMFKMGYPNGKGIYYYNESVYHAGNFQDGIKEGKGETHFLRKGLPDSLVTGFWSADEYRGEKYITYTFNSSQTFDSYEITPSAESGNSLTIEISTTSGAPDGTPTTMSGSSGYILTLTDLVSTSGDFIKQISTFATASKSSFTYKLTKYPARLLATLSNGQTMEFEFYKSANWTVRLFMNK